MKKIPLNDLPAWSQWPERLLGIAPWQKLVRDEKKVEQEYNQKKYADCLNFAKSKSKLPTIDEVKTFELGPDSEKTCVSVGNELALTTLRKARETYYDLIFKNLKSEFGKDVTVIEFGCGYGYNLWMLNKKLGKNDMHWYGGEYSANAVTVAHMMFDEKYPNIHVEKFNFYDKDYKLPEGNKFVIFTAHAIEQIPDISNLFDVLTKYRDRIKTVVHFEPTYEACPTSLIGLLRKKYTEANDYNLNLLTELKRREGDIVVKKIEPFVFGLNPLNATTIIKWNFK